MTGDFIFVLIITIFSLGFVVGTKSNENIMRKHAIEMQCAEYNATTSKFEWVRRQR